jgi:predicted hotdog family 3-hydroxylacyl-ACP dehydratase
VSFDSFPPVADLVPHAAPMLLLDRVLEHDDLRTVCSVRSEDSALFAEASGDVPSWVGLEYMAQCAAVHGGLAAKQRGEAPRPGLLLGSRRLQLHVPVFSAGRPLRVVVRHHRGELGLVTFDCWVESEDGDEVLAEGRVNLYILKEWGELGEIPVE